MIIGRKIKQPAEVKDFPIDYASWFAAKGDNDTIASVTHFVTGLGLSPDSALHIDKIVIAPTALVVWVSGGTDKKRYKVTINVITANGRVDQSEFIVKAKDY